MKNLQILNLLVLLICFICYPLFSNQQNDTSFSVHPTICLNCKLPICYNPITIDKEILIECGERELVNKLSTGPVIQSEKGGSWRYSLTNGNKVLVQCLSPMKDAGPHCIRTEQESETCHNPYRKIDYSTKEFGYPNKNTNKHYSEYSYNSPLDFSGTNFISTSPSPKDQFIDSVLGTPTGGITIYEGNNTKITGGIDFSTPSYSSYNRPSYNSLSNFAPREKYTGNMRDLSPSERVLISGINAYEFQNYFHLSTLNDVTANWRIFTQYDHLQFPEFREFIKGLAGYHDFMIWLCDKIDTKDKFRDKFAYLQGWGYSKRVFRKGKYESHNWVRNEAASVKQEKKAKIQQEVARQERERKTHIRNVYQEYQEAKQKTALDFEKLQQKTKAYQRKIVDNFLKFQAKIKNKYQLLKQEKLIKNELAQKKQPKFSEIRKNILLAQNQYEENQIPEILEIKKCIGSYILETPKQYDQKIYELAKLEKEYSDKAIEELIKGNSQKYQLYKDRKLAISKSIIDPNQTHQQLFELNDHAKEVLLKHDIAIENLILVEGNPAQLDLHKEIVTTINDMSKLQNIYKDNIHIKNIASIVYRLSEIAFECNKNQEYFDANSFSLMSSLLYNTCKKFAKTTYKYSKTISKGILKGSENLSQATLDFMDKVSKEPFAALVDAGIIAFGLYNPAAFLLGVLAITAINAAIDPNAFLEKTKSAYLTFKKNIQDKSSEELAEDFIALLFETIMIGKATGIASCKMQQLRTLSKEISYFIKTETQMAATLAAGNKKVQKLLTPIKTIFSDAGKMVSVAAEEGIPGATFAIETIEKNPELLKAEQAIGKTTKQLAKAEITTGKQGIISFVNTLKENSTGLKIKELIAQDVNFVEKTRTWKDNPTIHKHIFEGIISEKGRLISGLHTLKGFYNFLKKGKHNIEDFFIEKLPNGIRKIIFLKEGTFKNRRLRKNAMAYSADGKIIHGAKTLWPEQYSEKKILESIHEIIGNYNNYQNKGKFIGKTKDGLRICVRLNDEGIVTTAYPTWIQ